MKKKKEKVITNKRLQLIPLTQKHKDWLKGHKVESIDVVGNAAGYMLVDQAELKRLGYK